MENIAARPAEIKPRTEELSTPFKEKTFLPEDFKEDPPFSIYEHIKGEPYSVKYFGLHDWMFFVNNPQLDVSGLNNKVQSMEKFMREEIKRLGLIDSTESYASIINNLKTRLKVNPLEKSHITFEKILRYVGRARNKTAYGRV